MRWFWTNKIIIYTTRTDIRPYRLNYQTTSIWDINLYTFWVICIQLHVPSLDLTYVFLSLNHRYYISIRTVMYLYLCRKYTVYWILIVWLSVLGPFGKWIGNTEQIYFNCMLVEYNSCISSASENRQVSLCIGPWRHCNFKEIPR